jgi:hypothetical protein
MLLRIGIVQRAFLHDAADAHRFVDQSDQLLASDFEFVVALGNVLDLRARRKTEPR